MPLKSCWTCGRPSPTTRCDRCRAPKATQSAAARPGRSYRGTALHRRLRAQVWARDAGVCGICGEQIPDGAPWDLDHVVPHAQGGAFEADNLRVACVPCNRGRRDS